MRVDLHELNPTGVSSQQISITLRDEWLGCHASPASDFRPQPRCQEELSLCSQSPAGPPHRQSSRKTNKGPLQLLYHVAIRLISVLYLIRWVSASQWEEGDI